MLSYPQPMKAIFSYWQSALADDLPETTAEKRRSKHCTSASHIETNSHFIKTFMLFETSMLLRVYRAYLSIYLSMSNIFVVSYSL